MGSKSIENFYRTQSADVNLSNIIEMDTMNRSSIGAKTHKVEMNNKKVKSKMMKLNN